MDRIARAVEPSMGYRHELPEAAENPTIGGAMSNAACDLAEALGARRDPRPDRQRAHRRRRSRASARAGRWSGSPHRRAPCQQMALEWGVMPLLIPETADVDDLWARSVSAAREAGIIDPGDRVVIAAGTAVNLAGLDERDQGRHRLSRGGTVVPPRAPSFGARGMSRCGAPPGARSRLRAAGGLPTQSGLGELASLRGPWC